MNTRGRFSTLLACALGFGALSHAGVAGELRVAVASNFVSTLEALAEEFSRETSHEIILSPGSTGKLYSQILNGAPYEMYFSADEKRPALLEEQGLAISGSRFTYAIGRLVLWSSNPALVDPEGKILSSTKFKRLAIANPKLAPYGRAAQETLETMHLWDKVEPLLVRGENISQTLQFVSSGNAQLGLIARSQLAAPNGVSGGSKWEVPAELHAPITQQAVIIRESGIARAFAEFLRSPAAHTIIMAHGYDIPNPEN